MNKVQQVKSLVEKMDAETFVSFQRELQYGMKYHDVGMTAAQHCTLFSEAWKIAEEHGAFKAELYHPKRRNEIRDSPLYRIVREELRRRWNLDISDRWTGWAGLEENEFKEINEALKVIFKAKYPIDGMPAGVKPEEAALAESTVTWYKIQGIFIAEGDLIDIFLSQYQHEGTES